MYRLSLFLDSQHVWLIQYSDHNNKNHDHGGGTHDAQWVVDPVLTRDMAAEVENCRLSHVHPAPAPVPAPVAPLAANPGLGPITGVGLAVHPTLVPTPPSREEDEGNNRIVEVTGHPLRDLLAVVQALIALSESPQHQRMLLVM
jgi:hypothetical protein